MVIVADNDPKVTLHGVAAKFRFVRPAAALDIQCERQAECARGSGHILLIRNNRIVCESCGAEWKDFGY